MLVYAGSGAAVGNQCTCARLVGDLRPVMQDLTMLAFTVVFFVLAFLYVKACEKLR
jgi:hypothetical protein